MNYYDEIKNKIINNEIYIVKLRTILEKDTKLLHILKLVNY